MVAQKNLLYLLLIFIFLTPSFCQSIITSKFPFFDTLTIDSSYYVKLIMLDNQQQFNTLKVTIKISDDVIAMGVRPCLVLAEKQVPSPYDLKNFFGKDSVKNQVDRSFQSNYSVDVEACSMADKVQQVQITPPFTFDYYKLVIYDLAQTNNNFNVDINIEYINVKNTKLCPDSCSYFRYKDDSNVCVNGDCICSEDYIGKKCQVKVEKVSDDGEQYTTILQPHQWISYKLSLDELKDTLTLNIKDLNQAIHISILQQGLSSISVPNFYHDFYNIPQSENQNCQLANQLLKTQQPTISNAQSSSNLSVIISFYNPNQGKISFSFRISSSGFEEQQNSSLKNILVIAISVVSIICFLPFVYICFKSCTKKTEQVQVESLDMNNQNQALGFISQVVGGFSTIQKRKTISKETIDKYMSVTAHTELIVKYPCLKEIQECVICLSEFEETNNCRMTVCFHLFHQDCLESWFKLHDNCPFCRKQLTEKAILENKENGIHNSYINRIISSIGSDNKPVQDGFNEEYSSRNTPTRNRALSTEESQFQSNENILRKYVSKRSKFANQIEEDMKNKENCQNELNLNQQNIVDIKNNESEQQNGNKNIRDQDNLQLNNINLFDLKKCRSESIQIMDVHGDLAIQQTNEFNIGSSQNIERIISLAQNDYNCQNYNEDENHKNNSFEMAQQQEQQQNNQSQKEQNQEKLINLEKITEFSEQIQTFDERSSASIKRNRFNLNDIYPSIRMNKDGTPKRKLLQQQLSLLNINKLQNYQMKFVHNNQDNNSIQEKDLEEKFQSQSSNPNEVEIIRQ